MADVDPRPEAMCKISPGRPTALVHRDLFDQVLADRDAAHAELFQLKTRLRELADG